MGTTEPIRNRRVLNSLKKYYQVIEPNPRNYLLIVTGVNTALRISDILSLRWRDVYDFGRKKFRNHITLTEKKTGKKQNIAINCPLHLALLEYRKKIGTIRSEEFIFKGRQDAPINRTTAYRIVRKAATAVGAGEHISCHSLRKTFGYYAWKHGTSPTLLMAVYNHSSFMITQRYLGISQEDKDHVYMKNEL